MPLASDGTRRATRSWPLASRSACTWFDHQGPNADWFVAVNDSARPPDSRSIVADGSGVAPPFVASRRNSHQPARSSSLAAISPSAVYRALPCWRSQLFRPPSSKPHDWVPATAPPLASATSWAVATKSSHVQVSSSGRSTPYWSSRSLLAMIVYELMPTGTPYWVPSSAPVPSTAAG